MRVRLSKRRINFKLDLEEFDNLLDDGFFHENIEIASDFVLNIKLQLSNKLDHDLSLECNDQHWLLELSSTAAKTLREKLPRKAGLAFEQTSSNNSAIKISLDIDIRSQRGLHLRKAQEASL